MQTRSEALLEALRQVDVSIIDNSQRIGEAVRILEDAGNEHAAAIRASARMHARSLEKAAGTVKEAAQLHGRSIEKAADKVTGGLIVAAVLFIAGSVTAARSQMARTEYQIIEMFSSFWILQQKYGAMTYKFVLKRAYVRDATRDERRMLLNRLILAEVIQDNCQNDPNLLFIDENSDPVITFKNQIRQLARLN